MLQSWLFEKFTECPLFAECLHDLFSSVSTNFMKSEQVNGFLGKMIGNQVVEFGAKSKSCSGNLQVKVGEGFDRS